MKERERECVCEGLLAYMNELNRNGEERVLERGVILWGEVVGYLMKLVTNGCLVTGRLELYAVHWFNWSVLKTGLIGKKKRVFVCLR